MIRGDPVSAVILHLSDMYRSNYHSFPRICLLQYALTRSEYSSLLGILFISTYFLHSALRTTNIPLPVSFPFVIRYTVTDYLDTHPPLRCGENLHLHRVTSLAFVPSPTRV